MSNPPPTNHTIETRVCDIAFVDLFYKEIEKSTSVFGSNRLILLETHWNNEINLVHQMLKKEVGTGLYYSV